MIRILKDTHRVSLLLTSLFILAALVSAYMLYSLPGALMLPSGYHSEMTGPYLAVAITFILGALSLYLSLKSKKEIIVFKEKSAEQLQAEADAAENRHGAISMETVNASIKHEQNEKDLFQGFLRAVCKQLDAGQGAIYLCDEDSGIKKVTLRGGYALNIGESTTIEFEFGEGLIGQAAAEGRPLYVDDVPEGYIKIISGLGSASPRFLLIVPIKDGDRVLGVIEIASFTNFQEEQRKFVDQAIQLLASKILSK